MVSNARLDLPEPESPVITTSASLGRDSEMSFRLCSRAPETIIWLPAAIGHPFYEATMSPKHVRFGFGSTEPEMGGAMWAPRIEQTFGPSVSASAILARMDSRCPKPRSYANTKSGVGPTPGRYRARAFFRARISHQRKEALRRMRAAAWLFAT